MSAPSVSASAAASATVPGALRRAAERTIERVKRPILVAATFALLLAGSLVMLLVAALTFFQARRLYAEKIGAPLGRGVLRMCGVRVVRHQESPPPTGQVIYISNHTSTLDVFIIIALGLPRARFFLSGYLRKFPPIAIIGYLVRIFWTVPQNRPAERTRIFQRAARILRQSGDSVYLSPEGGRVTTGEIGHFNKGAFHLATSLHAPIVPLYFHIPPAINPGLKYDARAGTVDVHVLPAIDTSEWRVEDLDHNRASVRDVYVALHERMRSA